MQRMQKTTFNLAGHAIELSVEDFNNAQFAKKGTSNEGVEGKEVEMGMTVDSSADYATNAKEYYRKALIGENRSRSNFAPLLGVKDRVKLGGVDTSSLTIKAGDCDFNPDDTTINQKEYEVKPLMFGTSFCIAKLEQSFVSDQIKRGSNNFSDQFEFMNFFYSEVSRWLDSLMEKITWTGTVAANGVDGLETLLAADGSVLVPTSGNGGVASAVTDANVIDKLKQARNVVSGTNEGAVRDMEDFVYIVSRNVYDALADAVSENKASGLYYIEGETLAFQGDEIYMASGASDDTIVATYWSNLLNIQDLLEEQNSFNVVDFMKTQLNRRIGVRVDFKFQPSYINSDEIYAHLFTA